MAVVGGKHRNRLFIEHPEDCLQFYCQIGVSKDDRFAARGNTPRAARVLLKTWRLAPHPDLAAAYAYARLGDSPRDRFDRVRQLVSPLKTKVAEYFEVHRTAHAVGLISTSTMVYGLGETVEERMMHFDAYRRVQDETKGFRAFIPWSFESECTEMEMPRRTGSEYLRMIALSRIMLDNIQHLQAGWVTEGPKLSQIALTFGADDFGGILMEENVVSATGSDKLYAGVTKEEAIRLIAETGKTPVQRNTNYEIVKVHTPEPAAALAS